MFIVMAARGLLTPSGVKCSNVQTGMELLTEFAPHRLGCYKHGPPDGGRKPNSRVFAELTRLKATSPTFNHTR
jgi:hypothetical protein